MHFCLHCTIFPHQSNSLTNELHSPPFPHRPLAGPLLAGSDLPLLAHLLVERTGKNQAEVIALTAEANKRIDRLEDKRTYKPKAQVPKPAPRIPRPLRGKQENETTNN